MSQNMQIHLSSSARQAAAILARACVVVLLPTLAAAVPTFELLGDLPGGSNYSEARGVSANGDFVVGESSSTSSGVVDLNRPGSPFEGFVYDAATRSMVGVGDLPGGRFSSRAIDVSADGRVVVGNSEVTSASARDPIRSVPFIWRRNGQPMGALISDQNFLFRSPSIGAFATATAVSDVGEVIVGSVSYQHENTFETFERGFYWSPRLGFTFFNVIPEQSFGGDITPDGRMAVGSLSSSGFPTNAFRVRLTDGIISGPFEDLGRVGNVTTLPRAVSADGNRIAGEYYPAGPVGTFVYTHGAQPPYVELAANGRRVVDMSGDGRIILDEAGGLYLDNIGPFDLREILAEQGVADLTALSPSLFRAHAISTSGLVIVGGGFINGLVRAWRVKLSDCDSNNLPDELEQLLHAGDASSVIAQGSRRFSDSRETLGYGDMISQYGRPWKPGTTRTPESDPGQPAEFLRAALSLSDCADSIRTEVAAERYLAGVGFPSASEIHAFEMLLGNEAYADALDPTIGLDGIQPDQLSDQHAFKGVPGISDLIEEELALLRGRALPGNPADWLNETIYYPEFSGPGGARRRAAVYNRLPPNAAGTNGAAYRSNYRAADNFDAALKFPHGHGDAYGHYLTAFLKVLQFVVAGPEGWPEEHLPAIQEVLLTDSGLELVRRLAQAGAARAASATQVADLLYRRDHVANSEDPRTEQLFRDPDPQRAWSMGEWAQRGALGAFFDWAVVSHLAPTDETRPVSRAGLPELEEIVGSAAIAQERLDAAGAGLDPLGLVQNVVPFGIDASGLDPGSGRSHYEQVRDAASRALDNARKAFEIANEAGQRLRDTDQSLGDFTDRLEDTRADHDQQLIEIFGFPSADDAQDNDLDPSTNNFTESQSHPDLTGFLATDEELSAAGMRPRLAPGQVQIAMSELRVAALRVEQAELALDELDAQIQSQMERIALVVQVQFDRVEIITQAGQEQVNLTYRAREIAERKKASGMFGSFVKAAAGLAAGNPSAAIDFASQIVTEVADQIMVQAEGEELNDEFDIEAERTRIQTWKEIELQGLEDMLVIDAETRELKALLRRTPQLLVDIAVAEEVATQAFGRLRQSIERGKLLHREKLRLAARTEGQLLEARWKDLSFRMFRNAALKNYRALFDLGARYVVLAGRAYAYEFDKRSSGDDILSGIYRERRLGTAAGVGGGLQGVLSQLDASVTVNNFNRPLESLGERSFSLRRNLLGIGVEDFPNDDLRFRSFLEGSIVERVEDLSEIRELAQISVQRDFGPGIVLSFPTEIDGRNFFAQGPDLPFGNTNFSVTRNAKIRSFAIRLDGVDSGLGTDPQSGTVFVFLLPVGDSILRENTNQPRVEDELPTPWAVVDQFLPLPPPVIASDVSRRAYNPWRSTGQADGNFLNEVKRHRDAEAQIELGQELRLNTTLAGRSVWNSRWLLVIPGGQWTGSSDPTVIRRKLLEFIYGSRANPSEHVGITDIRLIIQAYSH